MLKLHYAVIRNTKKSGLSIYEAELYDSAVVAQQLIGNLVYYSNFARYEPRIAKSWTRPSDTAWKFELNTGFICENGEQITPIAFRKSLLRSIKIQSRLGGALVFRHLVGIDDFLNRGKDLTGIQADSSSITFQFSRPVREGLLEALSYAPYGYICDENYSEDDSWRDPLKFIASGPYLVESIEIGKQVTLRKRKDWQLPFAESAPDTVTVSYEVPAAVPGDEHWILDVTRLPEKKIPVELSVFKAVPEYMVTVVLGNLKRGFFSNPQNRQAYKQRLESRRALMPPQIDLWTRAESFYPNQELSKSSSHPVSGEADLPFVGAAPTLVIQGKRPADPKEFFYSNFVTGILDEEKIKYRFSEKEFSTQAISDKDVDIRVFSQSIGGEVRPWTINVLFCSPLSSGYPDPSGRICNLIDQYEHGKISAEEVTKTFFTIVNEDAAIFPIIHYGIHLYISKGIDRSSIGTSFSVLKFDQLKISQ